jgi:hypothetical protein
MVGLPVWEPKIGHGSFFTIEFGSPRVNSLGTSRGEFSRWVYGALWQIREGRRVVAHSEDDRSTMIAGARLLDGASMRSFDFDRKLMTLSLNFDQYQLAIPPLSDPDMEEWILYLDDGNVVVGGPKNAVTFESASSSLQLSESPNHVKRPAEVDLGARPTASDSSPLVEDIAPRLRSNTADRQRESLGFEVLAISAFSYLVEDFGFTLNERGTSWLRYDRGELFVEIYHGRLSYEVDVELGLGSFVPPERAAPPKFMVQSFLPLLANPVEARFLPVATSPKAVERFVAELAMVTRPVVAFVIEDPESAFARIWAEAVVAAASSWEKSAALRLRETANAAWQTGELATVVKCYEAFAVEALSQPLFPSESARLAYARKHVSGWRQGSTSLGPSPRS